jgi:hypothetical protein
MLDRLKLHGEVRKETCGCGDGFCGDECTGVLYDCCCPVCGDDLIVGPRRDDTVKVICCSDGGPDGNGCLAREVLDALDLKGLDCMGHNMVLPGDRFAFAKPTDAPPAAAPPSTPARAAGSTPAGGAAPEPPVDEPVDPAELLRLPASVRRCPLRSTWTAFFDQQYGGGQDQYQWDYRDETGAVILSTFRVWNEKHRDGDHRFQQRYHNGEPVSSLKAGTYSRRSTGKWTPLTKGEPRGKEDIDLPDARIVLYNLPALVRAPDGATVFFCEGERNADDVIKLGLLATTAPMGAGKGHLVDPKCWEYLRGKHVVVLPDNDKPGRDHAHQIARILKPIAASVKLVEIPDLPEGGDVSDWIGSGMPGPWRTPEALARLRQALETAVSLWPEWEDDEPQRHQANGTWSGNGVGKGPVYLADGECVPDGTRGDTLFRLACKLRGRLGASEEEILAYLRVFNRDRCLGADGRPEPKPDSVLVGIARRAAQYDAAGLEDDREEAPEPYEPFPVEVLPPVVRTFVVDTAKAIDCDTSLVALHALGAAVVGVGNSRVIRLKRSWHEPCVLWFAAVSDSGTMKSPAQRAAMSHLWDVEGRRLHEFRKKYAEYKDKMEEYEAREKLRRDRRRGVELPPPSPDPYPRRPWPG